MLTELISKQFYIFSPGTITLSLIFSLLFVSYLSPDNPFAHALEEQTKPEVIIELPAADRSYSWGSQVRYSIHVSDETDGESRFGEINPFEVLLEVEYLSSMSDQINIVRSEYEKTDEHIGLTLIRKSDCFSCHTDKQSLVGPSFSEISNRYDPDSSTLQKLGEHIIKGSSGDWGEFLMPPHNNITKEEAIEMADFILKQGSREKRWIYSGLEGVIRVIEKPDSADSGLYRLTASYINSGTESVSGSGIRGEHTIFLKIE